MNLGADERRASHTLGMNAHETLCLPAALLWDLDNVTTKRRHLRELAMALSRTVEPGAIRVAAGRRNVLRSNEAMLIELGFEALSGGRGRSGADRQLLLRARQLHKDGVHEFVLASNDGGLARVARWGSLKIITLDRSQVSNRLVMRADSISVLSHKTAHDPSGAQGPPRSWSTAPGCASK